MLTVVDAMYVEINIVSNSKECERKYAFDALNPNNYPNDLNKNCLKSVTLPRTNSESKSSVMGFMVVPYIQELRKQSKLFWVIST